MAGWNVKYFSCAHGFGQAARLITGGGAFSAFCVVSGSAIVSNWDLPRPARNFFARITFKRVSATLTLVKTSHGSVPYVLDCHCERPGFAGSEAIQLDR